MGAQIIQVWQSLLFVLTFQKQIIDDFWVLESIYSDHPYLRYFIGVADVA